MVKMFYRKKILRKSCYNQKTWTFTITQWVESADWHCKKIYQRVDNVYEFDKQEEDKAKILIK